MTAVAQPSGTVTLVFSDIEGSTKLLEELGTEAYREALAEHRRIVREAYGRYSGYEVDYEGDAFFYTFASASDAVAAVSEAMRGLERGPIAIRVGIHTGTPAPDPPKYVGMDVHFAARVMSSAHGGQVVLSNATAELLDLELTELGEHRLKDISEAVALYQLGEGSFPPLKTISNTNLPRPASSFLGREAELAQVLARIEQGARLVTLSGPGGTGKTRLALEAASSLVPSYKAGVFWVGLATLRDPTLVAETIAQTLGAKDGLASHIGDREMLLLLDNLEQVIEAASELAALLRACPNLTLLVTSRELLRVSGEVEYAVPPLAEPEAVALFCARARLEPSAEIAELCDGLDSLPLAVELAAARTKALSPAQILERLSQRLDLLKGGHDSDPRQQTLRATIEWSYDLLTPEEQQLFARLSVFAGGCTLEAAEEVAGADLDTLQSLVEKSLVRFTTSELGSRYWMLETIREFAAERLDNAGEILAIRQRHADQYLSLAERVERERSEAASTEPLQRLADEHDNVSLPFLGSSNAKSPIAHCGWCARSPTIGSCAAGSRKLGRTPTTFSRCGLSSPGDCERGRSRSRRTSQGIRVTSRVPGGAARRASHCPGSSEICKASGEHSMSWERRRLQRKTSIAQSSSFTKPWMPLVQLDTTVRVPSATSDTSRFYGATTTRRGNSPRKPPSCSANEATRAALPWALPPRRTRQSFRAARWRHDSSSESASRSAESWASRR
jgi:predicted ATPase